MYPLLALASALALLTACATTAPAPEPAGEHTPREEVVAAETVERPIPDDSLYPLLVAEFALRRRDYQLALDQYLQQAEVLRDPGVSAHTTHLAQFLQREQEALAAVQLWVELEPDNVEANSTLATLLVRKGRTLEALPHLALVLREGGDPKFPILLNGFEALPADQQAKLAQGLDTLAREYPDNTQLLLTQALIMAHFEQFEPALAKLDQIYEQEPYQHQALLLESKILLTRQDPAPFAHLKKALDRNPEDQQLRLQYARLLAVEDLSAARKQFEILSAQSPRDGDLLLSLALINRELGDDLTAGAYLRQILALGQRPDEAHYYLGRIAEDAGETGSALDHYRQVEEGREFLSATQRGGKLLIAAGRSEESGEWFQRARASQPEHSEQLYAIEADLLTQADRLDAAMAVLNRALEAFPDSSSLRYARSMLGERRGDLALMESDLRHILARDPNNATALNALGYTLANRTERYDEAFELISRAHELQPDEPAILDSMGWILYRRGDYDAALDYLTRAYAVFPDPEVAAHLGEVLWVSGDTQGATRVWQGALQKDPGHEVLVTTLKRLGVTTLLDSTRETRP